MQTSGWSMNFTRSPSKWFPHAFASPYRRPSLPPVDPYTVPAAATGAAAAASTLSIDPLRQTGVSTWYHQKGYKTGFTPPENRAGAYSSAKSERRASGAQSHDDARVLPGSGEAKPKLKLSEPSSVGSEASLEHSTSVDSSMEDDEAQPAAPDSPAVFLEENSRCSGGEDLQPPIASQAGSQAPLAASSGYECSAHHEQEDEELGPERIQQKTPKVALHRQEAEDLNPAVNGNSSRRENQQQNDNVRMHSVAETNAILISPREGPTIPRGAAPSNPVTTLHRDGSCSSAANALPPGCTRQDVLNTHGEQSSSTASFAVGNMSQAGVKQLQERVGHAVNIFSVHIKWYYGALYLSFHFIPAP